MCVNEGFFPVVFGFFDDETFIGVFFLLKVSLIFFETNELDYDKNIKDTGQKKIIYKSY